MLKHSAKVCLRFRMPDGSVKVGWCTAMTKLGDIIVGFGVSGTAKLGKKTLDQESNVGQLGLKNDDLIGIK